MSNKKLAVVAFGGNALLRAGQKGTIEEQESNVYKTCDHKGNRHYLVLLDCDQNMDIHAIEKQLHQGKLSFASEPRLMKYLGVQPGSVTPFGLINDVEHHVHVFIDSKLKDADKLSFHPCINTASLMVPRTDFLRFLDYMQNEYEWIDLY